MPIETSFASNSTEADLEKLFVVNFYSMVHCCQAALPALRRQGGVIFNTATIGIDLAPASGSIAGYAATKAAVLRYTRHLAVEVGQDGIRVNAIAPGIIETASALAYTRPLKSLLVFAQWLANRTGPAAGNGLELLAFLKSREGLAWPDLQFHFPMLLYEDHGRHIIEREGFAAYVNPARPRSRGTVAIASADSARPPLIDPNYLSDQDDLRTTRAAIRMARDIIAQPAFDDFRGSEYAPGVDVRSDDELDAFIRAIAVSVYHPTGTCRMGADDRAVVDDALRVRGVDALRVVDASIMPEIVTGNTNAATLMIAERAADLIRSPHGGVV